MATTTLKQNKAKVQAFYDLMFNECQPAEALPAAPARSTSSTTLTSATASKLNLEPLSVLRTGIEPVRVLAAGLPPVPGNDRLPLENMWAPL